MLQERTRVLPYQSTGLILTILSGAAMAPLVRPVNALAQQPRNSPTIGFLGTTAPTIWSANVAAFLALPQRPLVRLAHDEEPGVRGGEARG
jgi:hypothetical protein